MEKLKGKKSFTLVEVMIVVAIISLLASLALPNLLRIRVNTNNSSCIVSLKAINTAILEWRTQNSQNLLYPLDFNSILPFLGSFQSLTPMVVTKNGFRFRYYTVAARQGYIVVAWPLNYPVTSDRVYYTSFHGVICERVGPPNSIPGFDIRFFICPPSGFTQVP